MPEHGERVLITGALGCVGAWVLKTLVAEGATVVALDVAQHAPRLGLILEPEEQERIEFVVGDICDKAAVESVLDERGITHLVHLAALQVPFCRADPALGALVNVVGTVNVFEAVKARRDRISHVVYASSVAVFAAADAVSGVALAADAPGRPLTHYGVYKQANEGTARVYWHEDQIPSIGLRPYVVYGIGRDQGMTAGPTHAMLAAALGRDYHISYGGHSQLHYAPDTARAFAAAIRAQIEGALVCNLPGPVVHMRDIVAAIEKVIPKGAAKITFDDVQLPFPEALDCPSLEELIGPLVQTGLVDGVAETVRTFQALADAGRIPVEMTADSRP